ncbi:MAG: efflux transporter periplasmic adaptor subunit [Hyphomicrobium sp.]|nr:MAG: efflux transporter periplasmic adaptor subunit [Hyphomicrobium sp.]PPC98207.1 MAG: efflux transporter periplasmic adaptor subunit [Hyphomicrobium sp.]
MAPAASGVLIKEIAVPGRIVINANAQAKIVPKLAGTVAKVTKQVGDTVAEGEVIATLESREIADAKGEYLAARRTEELAKSTFEREERLWKQKVTAEQDYLTAKNSHQEAVIRRDLAHQRLHTIGLSEDEIAKLPTTSEEANYRFYDIRSPISGRVIARDIVMGQIVGTDREAFSIADLATVWVEISISPTDLPFAKDGQDVRISSGGRTSTAKVVAINPSIDAETRSAKIIAALDNTSGEWRLGDFVNAQLISGKLEVPLMVSREAIQTIKGGKVVFVNEGSGFRMRPVTTGREDSTNAEILSGLEFGETVAISNTFTLKAELGKAEAEHEH